MIGAGIVLVALGFVGAVFFIGALVGHITGYNRGYFHGQLNAYDDGHCDGYRDGRRIERAALLRGDDLVDLSDDDAVALEHAIDRMTREGA